MSSLTRHWSGTLATLAPLSVRHGRIEGVFAYLQLNQFIREKPLRAGEVLKDPTGPITRADHV